MDVPDMTQVAPFPRALALLVNDLTYKPGWGFDLKEIDRGQGSRGLTFVVVPRVADSYHPEKEILVLHYFPVPPAAYDERSWRRWLLEQVLLVERHEACEFFQIGDERPYAPHHGPGNDPYIIFEHGSDEDVRTSWRGEIQS